MLKEFYKSLLEEKCLSITNSLKQYITEIFPEICENCSDLQEISENFQNYVIKITNSYAKIMNFEFYNDKNLYPNIVNNFEHLIISSIYDNLKSLFEEDNFDDNKLSKLNIEDFDIKDLNYEKNKNIINVEIARFKQITQYKSPKDKLIILCNICNFINIIYAQFDRVKIIKMLAFIFAESKINNMKTQMQFCFLFRNKTVINSDEDYYLSLAFLAIKIIDKIINKNESIEEKNKDNEENIEEFILKGGEQLIEIPINKMKYNIKNDNNIDVELDKCQIIQNNLKILLDLIQKENINSIK